MITPDTPLMGHATSVIYEAQLLIMVGFIGFKNISEVSSATFVKSQN